MTTRPLISVVMTSYNHQRYLANAIESVLAQTFSDFELIIIDDASQDESPGIIRSFLQKDSRISAIFHDRNMGISRTTNDGFNAARGMYVAYIQSDDLWFPEKLEKQLAAIRDREDIVIWSDAIIIDGAGHPTGKLFTEQYRSTNKAKSGDIFPELIIDNYICGQSMLLSRKILDHIQFDPRLVYANDYKFFLQLAGQYEFYFINEPLVKYRIHDTNAIHCSRRVWEKDFLRIYKYLLREYSARIPDVIRAKYYTRIGRYLYNRKHYRFAARFAGMSIKYNRRKTSAYRRFLAACLMSLLK